MNQQLIATTKNNPTLKYIFCDFYDTIVHRTQHPMQPFRIWAKIVGRELGVRTSIDELYRIRKSAMEFVAQKQHLKESEVAYKDVIKEIYTRLTSTKTISQKIEFNTFYNCSREADFSSEAAVQYLNNSLVETLSSLKEKGYKIYCVSDFHLDQDTITQLIEHHGLSYLYDKVYVSCTEQASKENKGLLFKKILEKEQLKPEEVLMVGDNKISDDVNAGLHNIKAVHLKHLKHKFLQKYRLFGNDKKDFVKTMKKTEKLLNSNETIYAEYLILFHVFIERLYAKARKDNVKNLFFLAREGYFLKKLFDAYQEQVAVEATYKINTHYLKMSRQGAMQISYKPLDQEAFKHLKSKYDTFSLKQFFKSFLFNDTLTHDLGNLLNIDTDVQIPNFFESEVYKRLVDEKMFRENYEANRIHQKKCFDAYLASFNVAYESDGMHLVDVGWGGTMQECLHSYFDTRIPVTGYYLGLQEIYTITEATKRYGLVFSVHPYTTNKDYILMANRQLYEQLLAAPHGSTLGYKNDNGFTVEYHKKEEAFVYKNYIKDLHEWMFTNYSKLIKATSMLCYDDEIVSNYLVDLKLRLDLIADKKKIGFINDLSKGFYQNVGNNNVGLTYNSGDLGTSKISIVKNLLFRPSKMFRYIIKIKPILYHKKLYLFGLPLNLFRPYIKFSNYLKNRFLSKNFTN